MFDLDHSPLPTYLTTGEPFVPEVDPSYTIYAASEGNETISGGEVPPNYPIGTCCPVACDTVSLNSLEATVI